MKKLKKKMKAFGFIISILGGAVCEVLAAVNIYRELTEFWYREISIPVIAVLTFIAIVGVAIIKIAIKEKQEEA